MNFSIPEKMKFDASASGFFGAAILTIIAILGLYHVPIFPAQHTGSIYIFCHIFLTISMFIIWRQPHFPMEYILLIAIVIHLVLFPAPIFSSNDSERYLWDGAVALAGFDPYILSPNSPELAELRKIWPTPEEHAKYPTLYPPGALLLFSLSALAGPVKGIWIWKALATLASLASIIIGYDLLKRRNLLKHFPLLALSPLLIMETAIGAHLDVFSVLAVVVALALFDREKFVLAGMILGWSASVKFLPALIAGPLLFTLGPKNAFRFVSASVVTVLVIYGIARVMGLEAFGLLPVFFEKWRFGSPVYNMIEFIFKPTQIIWVIMMIALMMFSLSAFMARKKQVVLAVLVTLCVPLFLSPVVFPWYLLVLIPFVALRPNTTILAWVSVAPLSYIVLNKWASEGLWQPQIWPLWITAIAIITGLILDSCFQRLSKPND